MLLALLIAVAVLLLLALGIGLVLRRRRNTPAAPSGPRTVADLVRQRSGDAAAPRDRRPAHAAPAPRTPDRARHNPAPAGKVPAAQTPAAQTPAAQTPAAQTPAAQTPAAQTPAAQTPAAQVPVTRSGHAPDPSLDAAAAARADTVGVSDEVSDAEEAAAPAATAAEPAPVPAAEPVTPLGDDVPWRRAAQLTTAAAARASDVERERETDGQRKPALALLRRPVRRDPAEGPYADTGSAVRSAERTEPPPRSGPRLVAVPDDAVPTDTAVPAVPTGTAVPTGADRRDPGLNVPPGAAAPTPLRAVTAGAPDAPTLTVEAPRSAEHRRSVEAESPEVSSGAESLDVSSDSTGAATAPEPVVVGGGRAPTPTTAPPSRTSQPERAAAQGSSPEVMREPEPASPRLAVAPSVEVSPSEQPRRDVSVARMPEPERAAEQESFSEVVREPEQVPQQPAPTPSVRFREPEAISERRVVAEPMRAARPAAPAEVREPEQAPQSLAVSPPAQAAEPEAGAASDPAGGPESPPSRAARDAGHLAAERAAADLALLRTFGPADLGSRPGSAPVVALESPAGPEPAPVTGAAQPVRFRAVRRDGTAVAEAAVALLDDRGREASVGRSDAAGAGELQAPYPGSYLLVATAPDHQPGAVALSVLDAPAEVEMLLVRSAALTGRVTDEDGPVAGARITLVQDGEVVAAANTGPDGSYRVGDLAAGEYAVSVAAAGCEPDIVLVSVLDEAESDHDVELSPADVTAG